MPQRPVGGPYTVRSEVDLNLDPAGYQTAKAAFDREHAPFEEAVRKFEAEELPNRFAKWEQAGAADTAHGPAERTLGACNGKGTMKTRSTIARLSSASGRPGCRRV